MKSISKNALDESVQYLKSVGPKRAESFSKIGIKTIDKAPSPKILLNKLGNLKATFTQSAIALDPKVAAINNSLAKPKILESMVKKATITPDFKVKVSNFFNDYSKDKSVNDFFIKYNNQIINKPERFVPSREFLDYHYQNIFLK